MFQTLIGKFTFFFWSIFLIINIPIYIFGNYYVKNILQTTEKEKIVLVLETLKPTLSLNIFLEQNEQLDTTINNLLNRKNIQQILLHVHDEKIKVYTSREKAKQKLLFNYTTDIKDQFTHKKIASITLSYSSTHLEKMHQKVLIILLVIFSFSLIIFIIFYIFMKRNLHSLNTISTTLREYARTRQHKIITLVNTNTEIVTIANVANEMMNSIDVNLKKLKSFNSELQKEVQEKMKEVKEQENLIVHQSRQAAMGEMLESIAHQWRQPLNIIGLASANIDMQYKLGTIDNKEFQEKMDIISLNLEYMSTTIDDFRKFLNPDREIKEFSPYKALQETLQILHAQLENNNIDINIENHDGYLYRGHENEFKQVLFILINNAKDALKTTQKTEGAYIYISLYKKDNYGVIEVLDNGGGIDESIIHSIFDAYFTTKFSSQGTGIGLHIAKNIIEARMHGKLSVKNQKDGACFTIKVPLQKGIPDETS